MKSAFNAMRISNVVFLVPEKTYSLIANGVKIKNSSSHVMRIVTYDDALFNMGKSLWVGGVFWTFYACAKNMFGINTGR